MTTQAPSRAATDARARANPVRRIALVALVAAILFTLYWRQALATPVTSDGASNALQAWDMLHGNLLLHDWRVSDVSFYTTELPQYMLVEAVLGLGPRVVHVAAAMTYTLLVLLAALLAKGGASSVGGPAETARAGMARALLAGGIMLAPQLGAAQILLAAPDHTGTAVPLLLTWLVIDRAGPEGRCRPRETTPLSRGDPSPRSPLGHPPDHGGTPFPRTLLGRPPDHGRMPSPRSPLASRIPLGLVPVAVCVILAWTMVADSVVLLTGIVPLVLVCAVRACPGVMRGERRAPRWYELSLAGAAAAAAVIGVLAPRVITALGGYRESPVGTGTAIGQLPHGAWVTFQAILELFGANVFGAHPAIEAFFVALHLAGAIIVVWGLCAAARQFRSAELMVPVFAVAIVLSLGAYLISAHSRDVLGAREIAAVLPLGAVLAGRVLGERVLGERVLAATVAAGKRWLPVFTLVAAGYLGALAYGAAQPPAPPASQTLAAWLVAHRLGDGLAGYWQADSATLDSGGRVLVSGVTVARGRVVPYQWETDDAGYAPSLHYANFVVAAGPAAPAGLLAAAVHTFGRPQRYYHYDGYTVLVWGTNLLRRLG